LNKSSDNINSFFRLISSFNISYAKEPQIDKITKRQNKFKATIAMHIWILIGKVKNLLL
jgi:hypothetical protein